MAKAGKPKWTEVAANFAIVLISLASLFATVSWISSSKASGPATEYKTEALAMMVLRLESITQASTARVQAQTYLTQAGMYWAYADRENNENVKDALENLGYVSYQQSIFQLEVAENAENKAKIYENSYGEKLEEARKLSNVADLRSTGALIFTATAIIGSSGALVKRREIVYIAIPIFAVASYFLTSSFLV
jgi:hypothetical protein